MVQCSRMGGGSAVVAAAVRCGAFSQVSHGNRRVQSVHILPVDCLTPRPLPLALVCVLRRWWSLLLATPIVSLAAWRDSNRSAPAPAPNQTSTSLTAPVHARTLAPAWFSSSNRARPTLSVSLSTAFAMLYLCRPPHHRPPPSTVSEPPAFLPLSAAFLPPKQHLIPTRLARLPPRSHVLPRDIHMLFAPVLT